MEISKRSLGAKGITDVHLLRKDYLSAQLVEIGIVIQVLQGTDYAVEYLSARKVDRNVVRRVLLYPTQRRKYSEKQNAPS